MSDARMVPPATIGLIIPPTCSVIAVTARPLERAEPTAAARAGA